MTNSVQNCGSLPIQKYPYLQCVGPKRECDVSQTPEMLLQT